MKFYNYLTLFILLVFVSCNQDNDPKVISNSDFYNSYYQNNIQPALTAFKKELTKEVQYLEKLEQTKSKADFELAKTQWLVCATSYARARVYNLGRIKQLFFDKKIHNAPAAAKVIEINIEEKVIFNTAYFKTKSTTSKGLGGLEYLFYNDNNPEKAYDLLQKDIFRLNYMVGLGKELLVQTDLLIATWENEYKQVFINLNENTCTQNAKCLSFNQLINLLDITRVTKIGKTAGFEKSDQLAPKNLEAFRSKTTLLLIKAMLEEVKYVYQQSDTNFADLVNSIDSSGNISSQINLKFQKLEELILAFDNNLFDAINTDAKTVQPIYDTFTELVVLFSVDAASTLSLTVLPTDNDGD